MQYNGILAQNIFNGLLGIFFLGCGEYTLKIDNPSRDNRTDHTDKNGSETFSTLSFGGIQSITNITDSSLTITWDPHDEAIQYQVYVMLDNKEELLHSLDAPASSFLLTSLKNNAIYILRVRLVDRDLRVDANTNDHTVKTLLNPEAPQAIINIYPGYTPSLHPTPSFRVEGVKAKDTVKLFLDSECSTLIGSSVAQSHSVDITTSPLPAGNHSIYAQAIGIYDNRSDCSSVPLGYLSQQCPSDFIPIPRNPTFTTSDFCVMKYEAKAFKNDTEVIDEDGCAEPGCTTLNWASIFHADTNPNGYKPVSSITGKPWRRISQTNAKDACTNLGDGYALINNLEWMTIAHNIEKTATNWSEGVVGQGHLNRGHTNASPAEPCHAQYEQVQTNCSTLGSVFDQIRTHNLSNNEKIWDFAGNVWEWVDWNVTPSLKAYIQADGQPISGWRDWAALRADPVNTGPSDPMAPWTWSSYDTTLTTAHNIGRYWAGVGTTGGAAMRGGWWNDWTNAGVMSLSLTASPSTAYEIIGLRCVFRP
jgi:hypothetical protein